MQVAIVEQMVIVPVAANMLVIWRGVDEDFFLVEALQCPGWVDVIEGVEEGCDEMHGNGA